MSRSLTGTVLALDPAVQHYAWGSPVAIPRLLGRPPDGRPWAELWFGTHPHGDASAAGRPLADVVAEDPAAVLGQKSFERYGPRLPYLFKVLAVERSLSLQVHPGPAQAAAGFAEEERQGLPVGHPARRFADPFHKPEMVVALTPFEALVGFRSPAETASLLARLGVPELQRYAAALAARPDAAGLRATVEAFFGLDRAELHRLTAAVAASAAQAPAALSTAAGLSAEYPADPGALVALLMGRVVLQPGEALFLPPGVLHSYQRGLAVEAMAASDNVLRGGLTPKPVDVARMLQALRCTETPSLRVQPRPIAPGVVAYAAAVEEFALSRLDAAGDPVGLPWRGPRIVLCTAGSVEVTAGGSTVTVGCGRAVFVPGVAGTLRVGGSGTAWHVTTGTPVPR